MFLLPTQGLHGEGLFIHYTSRRKWEVFGGFKSRKWAVQLSCPAALSLGQHLHGKLLIQCGLGTVNRQHRPCFYGEADIVYVEVGDWVSLGFSVKEASLSRPTLFLELQSLQAQEGSWGSLCGSSKPQHGGEEWFLLLWAVFPGNQGDVGLTSSGDIRLRLFTYRYLYRH